MKSIAKKTTIITLFLFVNICYSQSSDIFSLQTQNKEIFGNDAVESSDEKENKNKQIGLNFEQISITDFFKILSDFHKVKFIIPENISDLISINIDEMDLSEVIALVEEAADLKIVKKSNVYIVKKKNSVGCSHNGDYYYKKAMKEIKNKLYICDDYDVPGGDVFSKKKELRWVVVDNQ